MPKTNGSERLWGPNQAEAVALGIQYDYETGLICNIPISEIDDDGFFWLPHSESCHRAGGRDLLESTWAHFDLDAIEEGSEIADPYIDYWIGCINDEIVITDEDVDKVIGFTARESNRRLHEFVRQSGAGPHGYYNDAWRELKCRANPRGFSFHPEADPYYSTIKIDPFDIAFNGATTGTSGVATFTLSGTSTATTGEY